MKWTKQSITYFIRRNFTPRNTGNFDDLRKLQATLKSSLPISPILSKPESQPPSQFLKLTLASTLTSSKLARALVSEPSLRSSSSSQGIVIPQPIDWPYWAASSTLSSSVCSQLNIIMLRSYLDSSLPRSRSTSFTVSAWSRLDLRPGIRAAVTVSAALGSATAGEVGTAKVTPPLLGFIWAADAAASSRSRLNSLCESRSSARYVVNSLWDKGRIGIRR